MKAAALAVAALALAGMIIPLAANAQSFEGRLFFYPEVPTEKSPVTARVLLATPTPCYGAEVQSFEKSGNNEISINVKVTPPSPETTCAQVLKEHLLEKDIGTLKVGAYTARL
ncbi:MAG TPA: hypothetical protein VFA15_04290, partial [Nitrososphaera sp.]|nr:hypothetical protein [Nitrososphaera sp.]